MLEKTPSSHGTNTVHWLSIGLAMGRTYGMANSKMPRSSPLSGVGWVRGKETRVTSDRCRFDPHSRLLHTYLRIFCLSDLMTPGRAPTSDIQSRLHSINAHA